MSFWWGVAYGSVIAFAVCSWWYRHKVAASPRVEEEKLYGHPRPPVGELRKSLPHPPPGHGWEIMVTADEYGDYLMRLELVDLAKGQNLCGAEANLTQYRPHGTTWATFYRKYGGGRVARDAFDVSVTGGLVDWAHAQVNKVHAGETFDYHMEA